jgi:outer membrane protein
MRDFSDSRYAYIIDSLTLKQAAGTLEEGDLQLVNSWLR